MALVAVCTIAVSETRARCQVGSLWGGVVTYNLAICQNSRQKRLSVARSSGVGVWLHGVLSRVAYTIKRDNLETITHVHGRHTAVIIVLYVSPWCLEADRT